METEKVVEVVEVCQHCGQELEKASIERQEIKAVQANNIADVKDALVIEQQKVSDTLSTRQDKLDLASQEMLDIIQRIEKKVGADMTTLQDIKDLEARIRAKITVEDRRDALAEEANESKG